MTRGDYENAILTELQQPGANFTTGVPDWALQNNPQYSQGLVDFWINQGYQVAMGDLWDLALTLVTFTLTSTQQTSQYAIPPATYAPISHVMRVFYQPMGQLYTREFRPGTNLISWDEFQQTYTGEGYLQPYAFGTEPFVCAITPTLDHIAFYPGSAIAGDTITVDYQPIPGGSGVGAPLLTAANSTPMLPLDTHMLLFYYAMARLWIRARESAMSFQYYNPDPLQRSLYGDLLRSVKFKYTRKSNGEVQRIVPFTDYLGLDPFAG